MSIPHGLGLGSGEARSRGDGGSDVVHRIVRELDALEPSRARFLALFAFLLARVAHVDQDVAPEETREMERLVVAHGGISPEQAALVVEIAKAQNRLFGETWNFLAAREFANELLLTHEDYVSIRSAYREKRSVFQKP